jgi:hypothetical protein
MSQRLTDKQISQFQQSGFLAPLPALSAEEVVALRDAVDEHLSGRFQSECYELTDEIRIRNTAKPGDEPRYEYADSGEQAQLTTFPFLFNLWKVDPRFQAAAQNPLLVDFARQLLDADELLLFEDNVVVKQPHSKYLPWHQDYSYWPLGEPRAITVWIALEDVDERNGALEVAPGTHRLGERLPVAFGDEAPFMVAERPGIPAVPADPRAEGYPVETYRLKAGECGFHDAMVWHGSTPNSTPHARRALVFRYVAAGTLWLGESRIGYDNIGCRIGERLSADHLPNASAGS